MLIPLTDPQIQNDAETLTYDKTNAQSMTENKIEEMLTSFNKRSSWLAQSIEHKNKN